MARPTNAQYRWLATAPCDESIVPRPTAEACFRRGWAEIENKYRFQPETRANRLISSTFVLTGAGHAVRETERDRRLGQITLDTPPSDMGAR